MSGRIREATADKDICLQSPIDDLESIYHVFVWAVMHNEDSQEALSRHEQKYKDELSGPLAHRNDAQKDLQQDKPAAPIVSQLQKVMIDWDSTQSELRRKYNAIASKYREVAAKKSFGQDGMIEQAFWKWAWNLIAYEGVQRIVEVIYSHRGWLTKFSSFKP